EILAMAGDSGTEYGSGGMITKLAAAKIAMSSGCRMVIAAGKYDYPLSRIDEVGHNTWFIPDTTSINARKNWLAQHLKPRGQVIIDDGALQALQQGKSLLSVGVIQVEGIFSKGDPISILNAEKKEIARGLTNYASHEAQEII